MPWRNPSVRKRIPESLFNDRTISGLVLIVGLVNAIPAFLVTLSDSFRYPGVDLRCRVVAARALKEGLDPYAYEWREGMPLELLDPLKRHPGPSRATYPPTLLLLYTPLAGLPYRVQRLSWFVFEWSALVISFLILAGTVRSRVSKVALLALGLFFFVAGAMWRFHVERGQFYVFVLLLLALGTRAFARRGQRSWVSGIFFGLAAAIRPSFVVMAIPLALLGYRRAAGAMVASLAVAIVLTLPAVGVRGWSSYAASMRVWEQLADTNDEGREYLLRAYGEAHPVPITAEGMDLYHHWPIETGGSTLLSNFSPIHSWLRRIVVLPSLITFARVGFLTFAMTVGTLAFWLRLRGRRYSPRTVVAYAVLASITGEYFLPYRYSYADILFLHPLSMLIPGLIRYEKQAFSKTFVLAGLVLGQYRSLLGGKTEFVEFSLLATGLTYCLLHLLIGRPSVGQNDEPNLA
jgi:hypothetical protein